MWDTQVSRKLCGSAHIASPHCLPLAPRFIVAAKESNPDGSWN